MGFLPKLLLFSAKANFNIVIYNAINGVANESAKHDNIRLHYSNIIFTRLSASTRRSIS
jgi:hypothetical protein